MRRACEGCNKKRDEQRFTSARGHLCDLCRRKNRKAAARAAHLAKTYDLTVEEYEAILAAQGGVCAICKGKRPYYLAVDHDHELTERFGIRAAIRGLLCKRCNKTLRDVRDDVVLLLSAVDYLMNPPAKGVLFP